MSITKRSRHRLLGMFVGLFLVVLGLSGYSLELAGSPTDAPSTVPASVAADGAEIYMTRCMACHQMNGGGVPGVFPPLSDSDWVLGEKGRLIRVILNGMTGKIEVNGESYSGAMPPWGSFLSDEEMSELLTYIRSSWANDASEVTPEDVAGVREAVADRDEPWTEEELNDPANSGVPGQDSAE